MKIAIAGYGIEGQESYRYWAAQGHTMTIVDQNAAPSKPLPDGVQTLLGEGVFELLQDFDMVIRTAGLNPSKIKTNGKVWSATNEFFAKCPAPIIGVTGSKGKGTTCSLITSILRASGKTVHLVGNIGIPALEVLPVIQSTDIVVYELSSFQLWDLERSPQVAVIVHMEPDHLDVHADMDEYVTAKANIRRHQSAADICFYAPNNTYDQRIIDMPPLFEVNDLQLRDWRWRAFQYGVRNTRDESIAMAYLDKDVFCMQRPGQSVVSTVHTNVMKIPGKFNQLNACAAISAALQFGADDAAIQEGLATFAGLPHRLKFVKDVNGVSYYDDSIATTPGSSMAAIQAFAQPKVVILGGSSKGAAFNELASTVHASNVKCVIAIGDEATAIEQALREHQILTFNLGSQVSMAEVVAVAASRATAGDVVILSPACASFGMFKNYADRGDQFIAAVNAL